MILFCDYKCQLTCGKSHEKLSKIYIHLYGFLVLDTKETISIKTLFGFLVCGLNVLYMKYIQTRFFPRKKEKDLKNTFKAMLSSNFCNFFLLLKYF